MIRETLIKTKPLIVEKWIQSITDTYGQKTAAFLISKNDRFSNPVGYTIAVSVENILTGIIKDNDFGKIKAALNDIIKIRAVQDFSPSAATGFIFHLKKIISDVLEREIEDGVDLHEYANIELVIDKTAMLAFDLYMEAREKIYQIRLREIKSKVFTVNSCEEEE